MIVSAQISEGDRTLMVSIEDVGKVDRIILVEPDSHWCKVFYEGEGENDEDS